MIIQNKRSGGRPSQLDFDSFYSFRRDEVDRLIERLASRQITARQFIDRLDAILYRGHTGTWVLGRQRSGDFRQPKDEDFFAGRMAKDRDSEFLHGFAADIEAGRYDADDGSLVTGGIKGRSDLYLKRMRGTANEAFVEASDPQVDIFWELGLNERHCEDCPEIAALSPFTKDTLFTTPGSCDTACLGNCTCHLRRGDGILSFKPVSYIAPSKRVSDLALAEDIPSMIESPDSPLVPA